MADISTKELVRALKAQGWEVERTQQGHLKAVPPDPTAEIVLMGANGSNEFRAQRNNIARLKKSGFVPPWEIPSSRRTEDMPNGEHTPLDYLESIVAAHQSVRPASSQAQVLFTREAHGKWVVTLPEGEPVLADGVHGSGSSPDSAAKDALQELRSEIQDRIRKLQELEAALA